MENPRKKRKYSRKQESQVKIAKERINELFRLADEAFDEDPKLSDRYVQIARKIAMRFKARIPPELKKRFCRKCFCFLKPGRNCRVRTHEGKVVYYCMGCRNIMRFPYK